MKTSFLPRFECEVKDVAARESQHGKNVRVKFNYLKWSTLKKEQVCFKLSPFSTHKTLVFTSLDVTGAQRQCRRDQDLDKQRRPSTPDVCNSAQLRYCRCQIITNCQCLSFEISCRRSPIGESRESSFTLNFRRTHRSLSCRDRIHWKASLSAPGFILISITDKYYLQEVEETQTNPTVKQRSPC